MRRLGLRRINFFLRQLIIGDGIKPFNTSGHIAIGNALDLEFVHANKIGDLLKTDRCIIHQPYGGVGGQVSDIEIQAAEILRNRQRLNEILANHTGKEIGQIEKDIDRDNFMSAQEAMDYGVIDEVVPAVAETDMAPSTSTGT